MCHDHEIPCKQLNLLILTDDNINRALSITAENEDDSRLWGYILLPPLFLKSFVLWGFAFLHELSHCWTSVEAPDKNDPNLPYHELLMDLKVKTESKEEVI